MFSDNNQNEKKHLFTNEFVQKLDHKTPYFLFSRSKLIENLNKYKKTFPGAEIYYAMKANSEIQALKILYEAGSGFEVASEYEFSILKGLGIPSEKIIYGTVIKPEEHIASLYSQGVRTFACDNMYELEKLSIFAPGSKIFYRLSVVNNNCAIDLSEKFGNTPNQIIELILKSKDIDLIPYGISFHVGSQTSNADIWIKKINEAKKIIDKVKDNGITIESINLGGGYPCDYLSNKHKVSIEEIGQKIDERLKKLDLSVNLVLEPGRGLIASSSIAVATVIGRKDHKSGRNWLFLDLGVYNGLYEVMAYQGSTKYTCSSIINDIDSGKGAVFALSGPTGDGPDIIDREAILPENIDIGDKIIFHDVGAYSLVNCCPFNGFPKPCVYFV
jgi:ornithine decarboxylase